MQNKSLSWLWQVGKAILILSIGFAAGYWFRSYPNNEQSKEVQNVTINGISMRLMDAHPDGPYYRLDLCYALPDARDWLMTNPMSPETTYILFDEYQVTPFEEGTTRWKYSSNGEVIERCGYLVFDRPDPIFKEITLVVERLYGYETDRNDCETVRKRMADLYNSMDLVCLDTIGVSGVTFVQIPIKLLDDRIIKIEMRDFITKSHEGPWKFNFLNQ